MSTEVRSWRGSRHSAGQCLSCGATCPDAWNDIERNRRWCIAHARANLKHAVVLDTQSSRHYEVVSQ